MPFYANPAAISTWATVALLDDVTYHRTRQQLWRQFCQFLGTRSAQRTFELPTPLFNSIKSVLTARSDALTDEKRLAFDTALQEIASVAAEPQPAPVVVAQPAPPADF